MRAWPWRSWKRLPGRQDIVAGYACSGHVQSAHPPGQHRVLGADVRNTFGRMSLLALDCDAVPKAHWNAFTAEARWGTSGKIVNVRRARITRG